MIASASDKPFGGSGVNCAPMAWSKKMELSSGTKTPCTAVSAIPTLRVFQIAYALLLGAIMIRRSRLTRLIHHLRAVDVQCLTADETAARTTQKTHGSGNFLGLAFAAERHILAGRRTLGDDFACGRGIHLTGRHTVHADVVLRKIQRKCARHANQSVLYHRTVYAILRA